jgi:membrane protein implicated in regulation of membrane protease activity
MTLFWTLFLIASVVAEALTTALVAIWFIPGSLLAMIFSALHFPLWTQLLAFFVSALGIIVRVAFAKTIFKKKVEPTNADSLIGKKAVVIENIDNINATGAVKIGGAVWTARSESGSEIPAQTVVEIVSIEGVKLICK